MSKLVYDNEKWWQENGFEWLREIDKRRSTQPLYGIQEVVLAQYFSQLPKESKVLEFGAGFGRHANYLSHLDNVEYFAVDQSPTMLEALKVYTEGKVKEENVVLIEPRARLPFPDNYFDVVFTVSVLIHINPDHIGEIIKELKRVAKHVIIHFENKLTDASELQFEDHNGCWKHAVQNLYQNTEVINDLTEEQTLYVVDLDQDDQYAFRISSVVRNRLDVMGHYLGNGLKVLEGEVGWRQNELELKEQQIKELTGEVGWRQEELSLREGQINELRGEVGWRQEELALREEQINELKGEVGWRQEELALREGRINELKGEVGWRQEELALREEQINELKGEVGWRQEELEAQEDRIYELSNKLGDSSNEVENLGNQKLLLNTQVEALENEINAIYNTNSWKLIQKMKSNKFLGWSGKGLIKIYKKMKKSTNHVANSEAGTLNEVREDPIITYFKGQLQGIEKNVDTIAITHKYWLGVKNATKELYDIVVEIEELSSYEQVVQIGNEIIDKNIKKVVFSGFAAGWNTLCSYLKQNDGDIKVIVFWHGSTTHMYEDYSWVRYQEIVQLSKEKHIDRIAFAKESMCQVYGNIGLNVGFIKNHVEKTSLDLPKRTSKFNLGDPIRIGIYSSGGTWNKNAYTQIAAASLFKNATVSMVPYNERMQIFARQLGLKVSGFTGNISREELLKEMAKNDINFYITFSECAPLVPLESLNTGVICLTSNNHHYFDGNELENLIMVDRPDDAVAIYNKAVEALEHKDEIFTLYENWYNENKEVSRQSVYNI